MRRTVGNAIGRSLVSPVVEGMDLDAVVKQIDLQDILENHIDLDHILEHVDINRLLDKVDLNRHLDRVDMDRLLANVDVNSLIERSDFEAIIQKSSKGFFGSSYHRVRARLAKGDQWLHRIVRCKFGKNGPFLPCRPDESREDSRNHQVKWPRRLLDFGVAIQFRYCNFITRFLAVVLDRVIIALLFAIISFVVRIFVEGITNSDYVEEGPWTSWVFEALWWICQVIYSTFLITFFGRTFGMSVMGLLVVNKDGHRVSFGQTLLRSFLTPINFITLGWVVGTFRSDGKNWNDLIACTAVVYAWDAKTPRYFTKSQRRISNAYAMSVFTHQQQQQLARQSAATAAATSLQVGHCEEDSDQNVIPVGTSSRNIKFKDFHNTTATYEDSISILDDV